MVWSTLRARRWLRVCAVLYVASCAAIAQAQWLRAESAHVVVYSDAEEKQLRAFVRKLERFHALLEIRMPGKNPDLISKLTVYLVRNRRDLMRALPGVDRRVGGMYAPSSDGIDAIAQAEHADRRDDDDIILHEYTHHFMALRYPQGGPGWITEGFAEFFATADVVGKRLTLGEPNKNRALDLINYSDWIDFDTILTGSAWTGNAEYTSLFYAQSWLLTHYLLHTTERWAAAQRVFAAERSGESPIQAFETHLGLSMSALRRELLRYAKQQIQFSVLDVVLPEPPITVTLLPASADRLMLANIAFEFGFNNDETLEKVRTELARFPADNFALECAIRAEAAAGDPQRALDLLTPMLADANASPELYYLAGVAKLAAAAKVLETPGGDVQDSHDARVAAANYFARAIRGNETDYRALYKYWQIRTENGDTPDVRLQDVLVQAYNLAPQVREIALSTGLMLLRVNRALEARVVLNKLAGDPHSEALSSTGRRLVALIDSLPPGRAATESEIAGALAKPVAPPSPAKPAT